MLMLSKIYIEEFHVMEVKNSFAGDKKKEWNKIRNILIFINIHTTTIIGPNVLLEFMDSFIFRGQFMTFQMSKSVSA